MAQIFIEPADLDAEQARQVLQVLNQANNAQALADRIELPGEPDIGVKLAERLLRARAQLGGAFGHLDQVAAVPQIGPERFTDLCVALLGLTRAQLVGIVPDVLALQARLARLEQLVQNLSGAQASTAGTASLNVGLVLSIEGQPQPAWLGQTLNITLKLRDDEGLPLVNHVLTLEASEGLLQFNWGFAQQQGQVIQLRTGVDGSARITLDHQPGEPLQQDQLQALQQALDLLDASADSPDQIKDQFRLLATRYDDSIEVPLRHAIDIYSRDSQSWWQRFNTGNAAYEWPLRTVIVRAYLHAEGGAQQVQAQAVLTLCWKDWLPAWFTYLHDWLREQAGLASTFARAIDEENGTAISARVIADAHSFLAGQRGFAAQLAGQHLVGDAVSRFLAKNIDTLSPEVQEVLFPSLDIAADQIRAGNRGTLALVQETSKVVSINAGLIEEAASIRDDIGRQVEGFNSSLSVLRGDFASFQVGVGSVTDKLDTFDQNYATFTRDYGSFTTQLGTFNTQLTTFNSDRTKVGASIAQFNTDLGSFQQSLSGFQAQRTQLTQEINVLKTDVSTLKTKVNTRPT